VNREEITVDLVRSLVAEQFPEWRDLPVRPVELDGWDNRTFRLGEELSVRLPSAERYVAQVEKEHRWLPLLGARLPLPIPQPVARGRPGYAYPWSWSVCRWIEGVPAALVPDLDPVLLAQDLARFISALHGVDASDGPPAGGHSFHRGGDLLFYYAETRTALQSLRGEIDTARAQEVWERALASYWQRPPVWVHGDVATSNLLLREGRLAAVIDFGCSAMGDPACDLAIAWTFFSGESRGAFRSALSLDPETWARGRGWTLWRAVIWLARDPEAAAPLARQRVADVIAEHLDAAS
jgi:aminoglycoside phosphotransferase (APT) family kinase protein